VARRRLFWHLFPSYLAVMLLALAAVTWFTTQSVRRFHLEQTTRDLVAQAELLRDVIEPYLFRPDAEELNAFCKRVGERAGTRITVVRADGTVMADSQEDPAQMGPHTGVARAELGAAFDGRTGRATRYSHTLRRTMLYVAVPLHASEDGSGWRRPGGALRMSIPMTTLEEAIRSLRSQIIWEAIIVAAIFVLVGWILARRVSRPLEGLRRAAQAYARGDLKQVLPFSEIEEIAALTESMAQMAAGIDERLQTITRQRNEREAILLSMVEGVLAVDADERIVSVNQGCARMLGIDPVGARGKRIQETIRIPDLQALLRKTLSKPGSVEGTVILRNGEERVLQIHGSTLRDEHGHPVGAVLVLNDMTRMHRLERMRRDFVANVSHELKTPITSVKMAVEALEDLPIEGGEQARRFLMIISRQAGRLEAIVEDLLHLSRIEQGTENEAIDFVDADIEHVLAAAAQACAPKAAQKRILVEVHCEADLRGRMNPTLLENAVVNLIDNAIKYSAEATTVQLNAYREKGEFVIEVHDQGPGIESQHLERIFERFYRIDKGRSRELGGTGLGLAIVKHIAQAHGGSVRAESRPGIGSTFRLRVPVAGLR